MTPRARSAQPADGGAGAPRSLPAWLLLLALLAVVLLAAGALSGPAWAANTPPKVTKNPVNQTVEEGESATFVAAASGTPTPTVQWELSTNGGTSWSPIEGATADTLTIASTTTSESGYEFRATFTNGVPPAATSKSATLTVRKAPVVTQQPHSTTVEEGQTAVFESAASGSPTPTVQWQTSSDGGEKWTSVAGATSDQLTIANAKTSINGHEYRAEFKNIAGTATSEAATLTVQKVPSVTEQPLSATVDEGQTAVFEATASGFPTPSVQWEISTDGGGTWSEVEGATSNQLTVAEAQGSESGYEYRAVFTNAAGKATSNAATLTVHSPPMVTQQPLSTTVEVGEGVAFEAAATGYPTPTAQWEISTDGGVKWSAIEGATSNRLAIEHTQTSENGYEYRVVYTNAAGKATSDAATLTVATNHFNAVAWGDNLFRQLGDGSASALSDVPVPVIGLKFVTAVAAGGDHSLALLANATVVAWGDNSFGQLGDESTVTSDEPVAVTGLTGVEAIAAGADHSLALLNNGTVMAWGDNESGQLGIGSSQETSEVPVAVKGLTGVKAISAGGDHSLALLSNGTVMAWGENESGELGDGTTKMTTAPVAVKGLTGVVAISAGHDFSLALLSDGDVKAWGSDAQGQLGNNTVEEQSSVPVDVNGLSGVTAIAAGAEHALALLSERTVMAWGEDGDGELGNGTIKASEETPVAVSGLSGVTAISAGGQDSVALLSSGSLMTWGVNRDGTLGDGTTGSPSDVPVAVPGVTKVANVSAGGSHMVAFGEPIPTVTGVSPNLGSAAGGATVTITGSNFTGATAVKFGAAESTSFTVNSPTSITALAPAGTGTVQVTVVTPNGISPTGPADEYTYQQKPTVTKLSTKSGPAGGGTTVTITGTEFTDASEVSFGETSASSFTVNSPTSITAVSQPHAAGTVNVTVTNTYGASAAATADHFKYTPTVETVTPNTGSTAGGTSVTVTGSGFALGTTLTTFKFGKVKAKSVDCTSSTSCTMITPAQAAGSVNVTATVNKAISPINTGDDFTYM